jgi:hypothetical protein
MPSLPVVTAAVRRAIQRTLLPLAMTALALFNKHAVLGGTAHTPDHVLAPLLGRHFPCCPVFRPCTSSMEGSTAYTSNQEG